MQELVCWCYRGRDLWDSILHGFTYPFADTNQSIFFSWASSGFSECRSQCHLAYIKFRLLFWCSHALVSSCCRIVHGTLVQRMCDVEWCIFQACFSDCCREPETSSIRRAAFDLQPSGLLVYYCINNLLHFTRVFNIVISLQYFALMSVCVSNCVIVTVMYNCIYTMKKK